MDFLLLMLLGLVLFFSFLFINEAKEKAGDLFKGFSY